MKGMILFMIGLIVAMGGVGGVETSVSDFHLLQSTVIAFVGVAMMALGVSYVNDSKFG